MFDTIRNLSESLRETGYFIDPVFTQVVFLAMKLRNLYSESSSLHSRKPLHLP
jgi:hypothetical protein